MKEWISWMPQPCWKSPFAQELLELKVIKSLKLKFEAKNIKFQTGIEWRQEWNKYHSKQSNQIIACFGPLLIQVEGVTIRKPWYKTRPPELFWNLLTLSSLLSRWDTSWFLSGMCWVFIGLCKIRVLLFVIVLVP